MGSRTHQWRNFMWLGACVLVCPDSGSCSGNQLPISFEVAWLWARKEEDKRKPVLIPAGHGEGGYWLETLGVRVEGSSTTFDFGGASLFPRGDTWTQPLFRVVPCKRQLKWLAWVTRAGGREGRRRLSGSGAMGDCEVRDRPDHLDREGKVRVWTHVRMLVRSPHSPEQSPHCLLFVPVWFWLWSVPVCWSIYQWVDDAKEKEAQRLISFFLPPPRAPPPSWLQFQTPASQRLSLAWERVPWDPRSSCSMGRAQNLGLMATGLVVRAGSWYYIYRLTLGEQNKKRPADAKDINPAYKKFRKYRKL